MPEKCLNCPIYKDGRWSQHMDNGNCPFFIVFPEKCVFLETLTYHQGLAVLEAGDDQPSCPECGSENVSISIDPDAPAKATCHTCDHKWEVSCVERVH